MIFKGELSVENAAQYYLDHYDENICYKAKQSTMDKNYELIADYFADLDLDWLNNYEILSVELKEDFQVTDHTFIGFIDLLLRDKRDGKIVIIDHKSSEYPFKKDGSWKKSSEKSFGSYKKQMYLYAHAVYQKYGEFPKEMTWNCFKDGGKFATIPFIKDEYDETLKWVNGVIKTISKEDEFQPKQDFFYCHNICNFRGSCDYNKVDK